MTIKQQATKTMEQALELSKVAEYSTGYSFEDYKEDNMLFKSLYNRGELFDDDEDVTPVELYNFDTYLAYNYIKELNSLEGF